MTRTAIFPGSFDPLTVGHCDLVRRALTLFDTVTVTIATNASKKALFTMEERVALVREVFADEPRVRVETFQGLVVEHARRVGAVAIVRGLRSATDYAYEQPMAQMNRALAPSVESVFLAGDPAHAFVSSSLVKEVSALGGDIDWYVPPAIARALRTQKSHAERQ